MLVRKGLASFAAVGVMVLAGFSPYNYFQDELRNGVDLSYNLSVGDVSAYTYVSAGEANGNAMGEEINATNEFKGNASHKIGKISGNTITHEFSFSRLSMASEDNMNGPQHIDTNGFLNKTMLVETGRNGENLVIKNGDDLPISDAHPTPIILELLSFFPELPGKTIEVNSTWKTRRSYSLSTSLGELKSSVNTIYTFAGLEKRKGYDCAKITGLSMGETVSKAPVHGMNAESTIKTKSMSTIYFAYKQGKVVDAEIKSTGTMDLSLLDMGMSMEMALSQDDKLTINK